MKARQTRRRLYHTHFAQMQPNPVVGCILLDIIGFAARMALPKGIGALRGGFFNGSINGSTKTKNARPKTVVPRPK